MKKLLILLVVFSFVLSGCSGNNLGNSDEKNKKEIKSFEQPQNMPDIAGLVKSITGNEVTILKIEMDAPDQMNLEKDPNSGSETGTESEPKALTGTMNMVGGGMGMGMNGGRRPEDMDEDMGSTMLDRMKEMSSGEETVLIPVGIQMLKTDQETREAVNADLTDVTVDSMISIWLNKEVSDRKIAEFVLIR